MTTARYKVGDHVYVAVSRQELNARVAIASPNGRSLILEFDGCVEIMCASSLSMYVMAGALPVMCGEEGAPDAARWVEAITGSEITLRPVETS